MTKGRSPHFATIVAFLVLCTLAPYVHADNPSPQTNKAVGPTVIASPLDKLTGLSYPSSESEARRLLEGLGCSREANLVMTLFFHPVAFVIIVVLLTFATFFAEFKLARREIRLSLSNLVLAISLLIAIFQWHASLEQDAMQKYEAEIAIANAAEATPAVASMLDSLYPSLVPGDYERSRYVYIHLDNLEYALERYRQGFASASTTARAVITFAVHCTVPAFRSRAAQQVAGYSPVVRRVVASVMKRLRTA